MLKCNFQRERPHLIIGQDYPWNRIYWDTEETARYSFLTSMLQWNPQYKDDSSCKLRLMWQNDYVNFCAHANSQRFMSRLMTKPTKWHVRPAKTQDSLGFRLVWSESSLSAWRKLGSLATHWAPREDCDQTGRMPRLIWVFAGRTVILQFLSWGGSYHKWLSHV